MKKILILLVLFTISIFAFDEKYEELAQKGNICNALFMISHICFEKAGAEKLSKSFFEGSIKFAYFSAYYYKLSVPTRSNKLVDNLVDLNTKEEIKIMQKTIENDCANISLIRIPYSEMCKKISQEKIINSENRQ